MFTDPNTLTITLPELEGAVVAMKKLADGAMVEREMPDGRIVKRRPVLASVLVMNEGTATKETTLVFPETLQRTIEQANGEFVLGTLVKEEHPSKADWELWQLNTLDPGARDEAIAAFTGLVG